MATASDLIGPADRIRAAGRHHLPSQDLVNVTLVWELYLDAIGQLSGLACPPNSAGDAVHARRVHLMFTAGAEPMRIAARG